MRNSNAVEVARKMDEMDLALLQLIASEFSSLFAFSEQWITSRNGHDISSCNQRLRKFRKLGLIRPFGPVANKMFFLSETEAADEVLNEVQSPMSN